MPACPGYARMADSQSEELEMTSLKRPALALLALIALLSPITGCGRGAPESRQNVLVVVLDACRPDKFGCYGFDRPTTPAIDQLASDPDAVLFERHYVQGDWTKPSTASLFTGLYVFQHRVALGLEPIKTAYWSQILPEREVTLAERFEDDGYFTFGATRVPHLLPKYGFDQGFEVYGYFGGDRELIDAALQVASNSDRPFFGYLHLIGCHDPYLIEDRDEEYFSTFRFSYDERSRQAAGIDFTDPTAGQVIDGAVSPLEPDDGRFLHLIHESKLRTCDRSVVAPLLEGLRQGGLYDDTLIVLTADHGQELLEHGGYTHSHALWEEIIHVPLIVKFPAGGRPRELGSRRQGLSRAIDLYPSLLAASGIELPEGLPGVDLFSGSEARFALAERFSAGAEVDWALISGGGKVLRLVDEPPAFFDLERDPGESENLAPVRPDAIAEVDELISGLRSQYPLHLLDLDSNAPALSDDELEALRSLGYLQ
jgi:arylsulfatase A-like enzyme